MKSLVVIALSALLGLAPACGALSDSQKKDLGFTLLRDATGAVCQFVIQPQSPELGPAICAGLDEVNAVLKLLAGKAGAAGDLDAGSVGKDDLYKAFVAYRAAHGEK